MRAEIEVYFRINLPSGKEIELLEDDASALLDVLKEHYDEAWEDAYNRITEGYVGTSAT